MKKFLLGTLVAIGLAPMASADILPPILKAAEVRGLDTPTLEIVDSDQDGIENHIDQCLSTPFGGLVDETGCSICPGDAQEDDLGCFIMAVNELVVPINVNFDTSSAELSVQDMRELRRVAAVLNQQPKASIVIEGYTDDVGSDGYNMDLAARRAESVKTALQELGVVSESVAQLSVSAYGESRPISSNDTESGRAQNRRVQAVVGVEVRSREYVD